MQEPAELGSSLCLLFKDPPPLRPLPLCAELLTSYIAATLPEPSRLPRRSAWLRRQPARARGNPQVERGAAQVPRLPRTLLRPLPLGQVSQPFTQGCQRLKTSPFYNQFFGCDFCKALEQMG